MKNTKIILFQLLVIFFSTNAFANTMTYDSISDPNWTSINIPYIEDGITMTIISTYDSNYPVVADNTLGYSGKGAHFEGGELKFDMGGQLFNLDDILFNVLHVDDFNPTNQIRFSNGLSYDFTGAWNTTTYLDFSSISMAKNITYFSIYLPGAGYCSQIDFINTSPVPEPTTILLLGTGLVGVAGAARRKKKNQA